MNIMDDYNCLYLVLLLADVFQKLTNICLNSYGLDPCHYSSSLALSWGAMLKMTEIKLELINNIDMRLFMEKGIRGGKSYTNKRFIKVNNKT